VSQEDALAAVAAGKRFVAKMIELIGDADRQV
jgi:hypothetical protein